MSLNISFHQVTSVVISTERSFKDKKPAFWTRDITVTCADGTSQEISLYSDSADGLLLNVATDD